jgi:MYXO-CTERM domain-containing protein
MARATAITGPYTDDRIFYASNGDVHGPGQIGIYSCGGVERFTYHYYPTAESVLGENELTWSTDNWPVAGPPATTSLNLPCAETTPPEGDASTSIPDAGSDANTSTEPTDATSTSSGDAAPEGPDGSVSTVSSDGGQADGTTTKSGTGSEAGSAPASGGDGGAENTGNSSGCGCKTAGASSSRGGFAAPIGLIGLVLAARRRRRAVPVPGAPRS